MPPPVDGLLGSTGSTPAFANYNQDMPIFEYRCASCKRRFSVLHRRHDEPLPNCQHCGSNTVSKLVSLFSVVSSEESRLDRLGDSSTWGGLDDNDPASVARWAQRMRDETGEDFAPDYDEMVEQMGSGDPGGDEEEGFDSDDDY